MVTSEVKHDTDPLLAGELSLTALLRRYGIAALFCFLALTTMILVGLTLTTRDGVGEFSQASGRLMRERSSVHQHITELSQLLWLPDDLPLIANLHNGTFDETEIVELPAPTAENLGIAFISGTPPDIDTLLERGLDDRVARLLVRMHEAGVLIDSADGRLAVPARYEITTITHWAGMRLYSEDGLKTFERDNPVRATLIGFLDSAYEPSHRVADITIIDQPTQP